LRAADGQADRQLQIFMHSAPDAMGSTRLKLQLVLLLTDLALVPRPAAEKLMRVFGFTPAEARLAEQLSQGHSLAEAAERLQVSLETARSQLKAVFARTETHRQADLLRLLDRAAQAAGRT
jgi:DNA-binding CsgD family transcriptional regulator